ncbi:MAG: hypothetical protein ACPGLV_09285 [Bacteroidia bacterium]
MPKRKDNIIFNFGAMFKSTFINNYFIAFCASVWYLSSAVLINNQLNGNDFVVSMFLFFSTVLMYNLDRIFGDEWSLVKSFVKDILSKNSSLNKTYNKLVFQLFFALPAIVLFFLMPYKTQFALAIPAFVAFVYAFPLGQYHVRLRELPFAKIFSIALVWAWVGSFLCSESISNRQIILFVERFLLIYAITIPFDLRDITADQQKNIATIPIKVGVKKSLSSAVLAIVAMFTIIWITDGSIYRMLVGLIGITLVLLWNKHQSWIYYLLVIDGCIVLDSIAILLQHYQ